MILVIVQDKEGFEAVYTIREPESLEDCYDNLMNPDNPEVVYPPTFFDNLVEALATPYQRAVLFLQSGRKITLEGA